MSAGEGCPEIVHRGDAWNSSQSPCGKPVKRDGLCGIHAAVQDRRAEQLDRDSRCKAIANEVESITGIRPFVVWEYGQYALRCDAEKMVASLRGLNA